MRAGRPCDLVEYKATTDEDGTLRIRWKEIERRRTEFGGLSYVPSGVHLYHTGDSATLCGMNRSEVPSVNVALREGRDVCAECGKARA